MPYNHIKALDLARDGHWDESHKAVQPYTDELSCLIHAYLHRVEGDKKNANYWYKRIGIDPLTNSLEDELSRLYRLANAATTTGVSKALQIR